ncbi:MAG: EFR1 family ferrodoxin [Paludibacteraceae bacterium]|nr:EFR1 family ferrodoxin [Paludibacteraceae bacterium]
MVLYFSGTGNCLAIARRLAEHCGEQVMSLYDAATTDLTQEKLIGLVYPTYYFNPPKPVLKLVEQLRISPSAYVFIVIPCGAQTGNAIWAVERILRRKGIKVAYCHKVRVPDCSAIGFGRNPNEQKWKFEKFAQRVEQIEYDIAMRRHIHHFGAWGVAGWLCALPFVERKTLPLLQPAVNPEKCIGCGTCVSVCPQANIKLVAACHEPVSSNGQTAHVALIGNDCAQCLSCVHFCPHQAVQIASNTTLKAFQYHHPNVKLKDMIRRVE